MAKELKMPEKKVMSLIENGKIPGNCYCYPANFGDGHEIAFYPEKVAEAVKLIPKKEEAPPETEGDQAEESVKQEKEKQPDKKEKETPAKK